MENDKMLNQLRYEIAVENGMYTGDHELVTEKLFNRKAQVSDFFDEKAVDFDVVEGISQLSSKQRMQILNYFNAPVGVEVRQHSVIILTQHFTNLRMMSLWQQEELYQQTVDYYLEGYFPVIKVHPDDQVYYRQMFKSCQVIDTKFPSELLPYIFKNMPEKIATISSTGIYSFLGLFKSFLYFDPAYEKSYWKNHQFFLIGYAIKKIWNENFFSLAYIGDNLVQLQNMLLQSDLEFVDLSINNKNHVTIIDRIHNEEIDTYSVCVILDIEKQIFLLDWLAKNQTNIIVKKLYIYKHGKFVKEEKILFYCPNEKIKEILLRMSYTKKLQNSDIEIVVLDETELENRVAVLEAILKATEGRLQYLLNKKKDLNGEGLADE